MGFLAVSGLVSVLSLPVVLLLVFVNLGVLPVATYVDAWHLRTRTDWGQGPAFWAMLAMLPGLNVFTVLAYLRTRHRSTPLS